MQRNLFVSQVIRQRKLPDDLGDKEVYLQEFRDTLKAMVDSSSVTMHALHCGTTGIYHRLLTCYSMLYIAL